MAPNASLILEEALEEVVEDRKDDKRKKDDGYYVVFLIRKYFLKGGRDYEELADDALATVRAYLSSV